jgi:hypothetical protein
MTTTRTFVSGLLMLMLAQAAGAQTGAVQGWDFGVVPYTIGGDVPAAQREAISAAFEAWSAVAPVRFVARTTQASYLAVVATAPQAGDTGCVAELGQVERGRAQTVNVQGCADRTAVAQAVGHALGLATDDWRTLAALYDAQLQPEMHSVPTELPRFQFDRAEMALAIERLHALFLSTSGMHRTNGLVVDGRVDFTSIAHWILDVYIGARSQGWNNDDAFAIVLAGVTQSLEWQHANPNRVPLVPAAFEPAVSVDDQEFVSVMQRLDKFFRASDGLNRIEGLSPNGGPDFQALATWVFDVYLSERLRGISPAASWVVMENQIRGRQ